MKHQRKIRHKSWRNSSSKPSNMVLDPVTITIVSFESEMGKVVLFFFFQNCLQNCSRLSMLNKLMWEEGDRASLGMMEPFYGSDEHSSVG